MKIVKNHWKFGKKAKNSIKNKQTSFRCDSTMIHSTDIWVELYTSHTADIPLTVPTCKPLKLCSAIFPTIIKCFQIFSSDN